MSVVSIWNMPKFDRSRHEIISLVSNGHVTNINYEMGTKIFK